MQRRPERVFQHVRQFKGFAIIELAGDLAAPRLDGALNDRRRIQLLIQYDGEALADILPGNFGKALGALGIQREMDFRLPQVAAHDHGALEPAAIHFRSFPDFHLFDMFAPVAQALLAFEDFVARLHNPFLDILFAGGADQAKLQKSRSLNGRFGAFLVGGG